MKSNTYEDKVERFLNKFTPKYIVAKIFRPIDAAYLAFEGKFSTTDSYDELRAELRRFDVSIYSQLIPGFDEFARKEPKSFVKKDIENLFHPFEHYFDVKSGINGGIRPLLDNYIISMKNNLLKRYISDDLYREFDVKDLRERIQFLKSFCKIVGFDYFTIVLKYDFDCVEVLYDYLQEKLLLYKHIG